MVLAKLNPYCTLYPKIDSKWMNNLKVKTIKILEENIIIIFSILISIIGNFVRLSLWVIATKAKIYKTYYKNLKTFHTAEETIN